MKTMKSSSRRGDIWLRTAFVLSICVSACVSGGALAATLVVNLQGGDEVPAVKSAGTGMGSITVNDDKTVTGSITTKGIVGTKAHIHEGAVGKNGPVIIELVKSGSDWAVPPDAKLTDAQYASYKAGNLYVNVHTAANPKGEMRAQLQP